MRRRGFQLKKEGPFHEFLGVSIDRNATTNQITMTQTGLIQKIITTTGLDDCNRNWTPAAQLALGSDPLGKPFSESWEYSSVVGMLLYLATNTRPDIAFAVSQVARFNHSPKASHAKAVKQIVRYLAGSADKGISFKLSNKLDLLCYVDADFAGLYKREPDRDPTSVKSRSGFIISLGGCPLVWRSKLLTEIALSTLESEYAALSQAMRALIPIRRLILDAARRLKLPDTLVSTISAKVFEDNNGALQLATTQRITDRTKHFLLKYHFFWHHVRQGVINIAKIESALNVADYLTKGLDRTTFERLRKIIQGW
ncbi:MAG: Ty1/Copia family ribonuclease HI, partial [Marinobacter sp.]